MTPRDPEPPIIVVWVVNTCTNLWYMISNSTQNLWEQLYLWVYSQIIVFCMKDGDRASLLDWARSKAPGCSITNFDTSWQDGVALVALIEGLLPRACTCTQYYLLNPQHNVQNVQLAFTIASKYLHVHPNLDVTDLVNIDCSWKQKRLIRYLVMIRISAAHQQLHKAMTLPKLVGGEEDPVFRDQPCLAKGMGLMLAVRGRRARFNIYLRRAEFLDIVIDIRDPCGNSHSERITHRSPRNTAISHNALSGQQQADTTVNIPLEYEIMGRKVAVSYIPQSNGLHKLSIFWRGQHIDSSPYSVRVDDSTEIVEISASKKVRQLPLPTSGTDGNDLSRPLISCNGRGAENGRCIRKMGRVIRRTVLRSFIMRNGVEIELHDGKLLPPDVCAWSCGKGLRFEDCQQKLSTPAPKLVDENHNSNPPPIRRSRTLVRADSVDLGMYPDMQ